MELLYSGGDFFECPRWRDGRWWVSDFGQRSVVSFSETGQASIEVHVEHEPGGLGWMPDGSMLIVSQRDKKILHRSEDGVVRVHADLSELASGRLNDMVVDRLGRAYVGNFGADLYAGENPKAVPLILVLPSGDAKPVGDPLHFPNGAVISDDGRTLIVGESLAGRYSSFRIAENGELKDRSIWAQLGPSPELGPLPNLLEALEASPDGCCLDAQGYIWCAELKQKKCIRIAPGGGVVAELSLPDELTPYACMLGGTDGKTLLICAAENTPNLTPPGKARLFVERVQAPGVGYP